MTPRSIRRAAERKRMKLERKNQRSFTPDAQPCEEIQQEELQEEAELEFSANPISDRQLFANRANAQLSTGATSPEGKAKSSLNGVKTALTGRTVLLPCDDVAEYERHIRAIEGELRPASAVERELVQSIADTFWRLRRIPGLEAAIFAQGHVEFQGAFDRYDASLRAGMIELQTFAKYEKQLRNLHLQEARLTRRREKETAELQKLQQARKSREVEALDNAARQFLIAREFNKPFVPEANGFEFSTAEIERYLERCSPSWIAGVIARATATDGEIHFVDRKEAHSQAA